MKVCYPFIYEESSLCDYEIETDSLCSQIGLAIELLPVESSVRDPLRTLQELVYHQNGSLRGKLAITTENVVWLQNWYNTLLLARDSGGHTVRGKGVFELPAGVAGACALHVARCQAKSVVRLMGKIRNSGVVVPEIILDWANLVANHLFVVAEQVNREAGREEIPFVTKSY